MLHIRMFLASLSSMYVAEGDPEDVQQRITQELSYQVRDTSIYTRFSIAAQLVLCVEFHGAR
jgi:hypothetical protein